MDQAGDVRREKHHFDTRTEITNKGRMSGALATISKILRYIFLQTALPNFTGITIQEGIREEGAGHP